MWGIVRCGRKIVCMDGRRFANGVCKPCVYGRNGLRGGGPRSEVGILTIELDVLLFLHYMLL